MPETDFDSQVVARNPDHPWCDLGNEIVVLRAQDSAYYRLAASGRAVWLLLDSPQAIAALVTRLSADFEGEKERIASETHDFVVRCREIGLLIAVDD